MKNLQDKIDEFVAVVNNLQAARKKLIKLYKNQSANPETVAELEAQIKQLEDDFNLKSKELYDIAIPDQPIETVTISSVADLF